MTREGRGGGRKRSLILAGGGMKVAFQAGVMQVWLDEAGLEFDHVDGASGGTFNLAMLCQGMSGKQIADNWRDLDVAGVIDPNLSEYPKLLYAASLMEYGAFREKVLRARWALDWDRIRQSDVAATFNVYNFSRHELEVLEPARMSEDLLVACVSLPMWFPPVRIDGSTYIDAVYATDANVEEAIARGVDEIWVIWTVSERGEWFDGFVGNYFGIIEAAANGRFGQIVDRIEASNAALGGGGEGEFGRHIELKILRAEVPLHYLINLNADRVTAAVERGVAQGRQWCLEQGVEFDPDVTGGTAPGADLPAHTAVGVRFTEDMKGFVTFGEDDFDRGYRKGREDRTAAMFQLTIATDDVETFIAEPEHEAPAEGYIDCKALGGRRAVESGRFNLFVDSGDPTKKRMLYRLFFTDGDGNPRTLSGFKVVEDDPGMDAWEDTTTLYTRILDGHVEAADEATATILASGILRIHLLDFLKQLTTFRAEGPTAAARASGLVRFGLMFLGDLWDVYGRRVLAASPI